MRNANLNFKDINRRASGQMRAIISHFIPGGAVRGEEYIVRNPTRADRRPGSFKINLRTGHWADFATHDAGCDVISLISYVTHTSQLDAAKALIEMMGGGDGN